MKEIAAGEAESGRDMGDDCEDLGAKASRFIFLGSEGEEIFGVTGATGDGKVYAGETELGLCEGIGCAGAEGEGEFAANASEISASGQPTERKLFFMDISVSPEPSCCLT